MQTGNRDLMFDVALGVTILCVAIILGWVGIVLDDARKRRKRRRDRAIRLEIWRREWLVADPLFVDGAKLTCVRGVPLTADLHHLPGPRASRVEVLA